MTQQLRLLTDSSNWRGNTTQIPNQPSTLLFPVLFPSAARRCQPSPPPCQKTSALLIHPTLAKTSPKHSVSILCVLPLNPPSHAQSRSSLPILIWILSFESSDQNALRDWSHGMALTVANYTFGTKEAQPEEDPSVLSRLNRLQEHYEKYGMRRSCEAILIVCPSAALLTLYHSTTLPLYWP